MIGLHPSVCISISNDRRREGVLLPADLEAFEASGEVAGGHPDTQLVCQGVKLSVAVCSYRCLKVCRQAES